MSEGAGEWVKTIMRKFPQGVTIVTTSHKRELYGITVSSFTSISLEPPLVMISISKGTPSHIPLTSSDFFVINVLASDQVGISEKFAGRVQGVLSKFAESGYSLSRHAGCPILDDVIAYLECRKWAVYDGGDHSMIVGEVIYSEVLREALPLVYYNRQYGTIGLPLLAPSSQESLMMEW